MSNSVVPVPNPTDLGSTIINILDYRGDCQGNTIAYEFYIGENDNSLTYGELNGQVNAIAEILIEKELIGERVLLIYPSGLEFIAAFIRMSEGWRDRSSHVSATTRSQIVALRYRKNGRAIASSFKSKFWCSILY